MSDIQEEAYTELAQENKRLKTLLGLAAEALEKWNIRDRFSELIRQLRRELSK